MAEAYIIDAVRTPVGKRGGGLSQIHPADLGAALASRRCVERTGIDPGAVEDVVFGCVDTDRPARPATSPAPCWLAAGLPRARARHHRSTASAAPSQQAVHFAAQGVMSRHAGPGRRRRRAEHVRRSRSARR